jgi:hypothetical protein
LEASGSAGGMGNDAAALGTVTKGLRKLQLEPPRDPAVLSYIDVPRRNDSPHPSKIVHANMHNSITDDSQKR